MAHLELTKKTELASFRKIAIGTWNTAYDPSVYGTLTVRMDKALDYIEQFRLRTGKRLTVTHLVTKACAEALKTCPEANSVLRFNRIYLRKTVAISVLVVQTDQGDGKVDLTAAKIEDADSKSLFEIAEEMDATVQRVRERKELSLERGKGTIGAIPFMLMNLFLRFLSFLMYTLNIDLSALGMPRDPFGSLTVTNVGSIGLETAYVPLAPYTRVPIFVAPGLVKEAPVVENGKIVVGRVMNVNATFDHRFIDGYHASVLSKTLREMLENPFERFDALEGLGTGAEVKAVG